jgi:hypothetical protein
MLPSCTFSLGFFSGTVFDRHDECQIERTEKQRIEVESQIETWRQLKMDSNMQYFVGAVLQDLGGGGLQGYHWLSYRVMKTPEV